MTAPSAVIDPAEPVETLTIPEFLPPDCPPPEPARPVGFLAGLCLLWLRPGRIGPHLIARGNVRAVLAAIVTTVSIAVLAGMLMVGLRFHWEGGLTEIRSMLANALLRTAAFTAGTDWDWVFATAAICSPFALVLVGVLIGTLFLPWAAHGNTFASAWGRSIRGALWTLTVLMPLGCLWVSLYVGLAYHPYTGTPAETIDTFMGVQTAESASLNHRGERVCYGILPGVFVFAYFWTLLRVTGRYVGPAEGPGFVGRIPVCGGCGYRLTGLSTTSNCPECGRAVVASYDPASSAAAPWPWQTPRWDYLHSYWAMQIRINLDPALLRRIPLHAFAPAARRFWWSTSALFSAILLAVAFGLIHDFSPDWTEYLLMSGAVLLPGAVHFIATFVVCVWLRWSQGARDPRTGVILVSYAAALWWPVVLVGLVAFLLFANGLWSEPWGHYRLGPMHEISDLATAGIIAIEPLLIGRWAYRLGQAMRAVRLANR